MPAEHQLRFEIATERLVDRKGLRDDLKTAMANRTQESSVIGIKDSPHADIGYVLQWILALARVSGVLPLHLDLSIGAGHDLNDLAEVVVELVENALTEFEPHHAVHQSELIQRLLEAEEPQPLIGDVVAAVSSGHVLLVLQGLNKASDEIKEWAAQLLDQVDGATAGVAVVIDPSPLLPAGAVVHSLPNFSQAEIGAHLHKMLGYPRPDADAEAAAIHGLGAGMPARVAHQMLQRVTQHVRPCL